LTLLVLLIFLRQAVVNRNAGSTTANEVKLQDVDTGSVTGSAEKIAASSKDQLVVNGQLQANQGVILAPTSQPTSASLGQLYFDQTTNEFKYYNGTTFVGLLNDNGDVCNKNDETCGFALQTALAALQAQVDDLGFAVTEGGVNSLQGAQGSLTLLGTGGLTISANGTSVTIALPQNLTTTSTPQFSDLSLTGGDYTQDGVLVIGASGSLYSVHSGGASGLCLVTDGSGVPEFNSCVAGAVTDINGLFGSVNLITTDAVNEIAVTVVGNSIQLDLPQGISTSSAPTFSGLTIDGNSLLQMAARPFRFRMLLAKTYYK
jgi:hypothetical protein